MRDVKFKFKKVEPHEGKPAYRAYLDGEYVVTVYRRNPPPSASWGLVNSPMDTGYGSRNDAAGAHYRNRKAC